MKKIIIRIFKFIFNFVYSLFKLRKVQNKAVMLSRQSNDMSIDFALLKREFEKRGVKVVVLCKMIDPGVINKIKYSFHILISAYHLANSKYCIVDTYSICVSILNHRKELKIVQIWHALGAIKKFGYQSLEKEEGRSKETSDLLNMHKNYTYITCASNATKQIYSKSFNTELDKIKVLGMPRIDYILNARKNNRIIKVYPRIKDKPVIVYFPTFRKNAKLEHQQLIDSIDKNKYHLIIRAHPLDQIQVEDEYTMDAEYSSFELLGVADYIITDYSAISIEAAILDIPVFFWVYDIEKYEKRRGLNVNLMNEMPSFTHTNIQEIIDKIEKKAYNFEELKRFKEKYVETLDTKNTERIIGLIM